MKSVFTAAILLGATFASTSDHYNSIINHDHKHFSLRRVSDAEGLRMAKGRGRDRNAIKKTKKKTNSIEAGQVSGRKSEWFQYTSVVETSYSQNVTQFGNHYKDDTTNNTRTEVVSYSLFNAGSGDRYYVTPAEYLKIDGTHYSILEADSQYVYCETYTPTPSEDIEFERLGYAFFVPEEQAFSIVWGPRLVELYKDPTTSEDTVAYYGYNVFNDEPVVFSQYNTTYTQAFVWSHERDEDLDATDFQIPSDLTCTSTTSDGDSSGAATASSAEMAIPWYDRNVMDVFDNAPF